MRYLILTPLVVVVPVLLALNPRTKSYGKIAAKLPADQLEPMLGAYQQLVEAIKLLCLRDRLFQEKSGGLSGAFARVGLLRYYLQLVWVLRSENKLSREDAKFVWRQTMTQLLFTGVAVPEALFCSLCGLLPHLASMVSFRAHEAIVMRCAVAFPDSTAPECVRNLQELL